MREVVEISHASFNCTPSLAVCHTHCNQLDLNPANLEATTDAKWILNSLSSCESSIFQWRHNYVIITYCLASIDTGGTFYDFSVTRNDSWQKLWKSCLKLSKLRPKNYRSLFSGHGSFAVFGSKLLVISTWRLKLNVHTVAHTVQSAVYSSVFILQSFINKSVKKLSCSRQAAQQRRSKAFGCPLQMSNLLTLSFWRC